VRINEDARIMDVNRKACEITGYNREELLMMSFASLCAVPEEFRLYLEGARQSHEGGSRPTVIKCRRKNGAVCHLELEMRRTADGNGGPALYESFLKDITDAHMLQEKLRESERRYREIVETSPAAFARMGLDGRITMVNPAFSGMTGYSEDELKAVNPDKLYVNPSERDLLNNRLIEKGEITNYTIKLRRKDGSPLIVMESARAVPDDSPEGMHFIVFGVDITEQAELSERLRRSEQKFREIIEQSPVGFCHLDSNYGVLTVNSALCEMTGYTSVELMGASFSSLFASYEAMRACTSTIEKNRVVRNLVVSLKRKSGVPMYVSMTARVLEGGSTAMTELFLMDITERYVLEMQLRESEERYRSLFEDSQDGLYTLDPATGYFTMYNRRFCELLGYTQEEFAHVTISDITHPDYIATSRYEREKRKAGKDISVPYRTTFIRKDGKRLIADVMARPLEHADFITGSVRDITFQVDLESEILRRRDELARLNANLERLVQERTLQLSEMQRFNEKVVNTAPVGVIVLDTKGNVTFANDFLKRKLLIGSIEDGKKPSILEAGTLLPSSYADLLSRCLKGNIFELNDVAYRPPHRAEDVFLNIKGVPLKGEYDEIEGALLVVEDATERVNLREKLISSARLAATGRLAANVAHEINNPLNSIRYNLDLITLELEQARKSKGKSIAEVKSYVEKVDAEIVRIARIVNNLLDLHRPEVKFVQNVNANAAVSETMELMMKQIEDAKVKLVVKLADELPLVSAVHAQLKQVILNIILNAIQAMPDGGTLTVETKRSGDRVHIAVADTGVGISRKDRRYVFEPFFTTKGVQGTGLGLSISYSIIKAYGGDITVKSEEGKGSCFTVQLPVRPDKA
jgi:PAS domain S-box-containing protein